jgi:hypothetical protein
MGEREEIGTKFWSGNLKASDHSEDLGIDWRIIFEWNLRKLGGKVWTGCIWISIETSGEKSIQNVLV